MDISIFEDIGLTKREINVYLALLGLGSTTIGAILEKTRIPSSKIYEVLNRLQDKGLVSHVKIDNKRHYQSSDPNSILTFLDEKRNSISEVLPQLIEKQKFAKKKQSVEIYEGQKAIMNLLRNIIQDAKPKESYLAFTHTSEHEVKTINLFYKNFIKKRIDKKLDIRLLANSHQKKMFQKNYSSYEIQKTKMRFTNFDFPHGMTIFRDYVITITWEKNPTAIKIKSEQIAEEFRNFFLQLWKISK
ncbi:MAG: helix-turn-helix domain-containing protein [Candidatus Woesearchaeota archaeon]